MTRIAIEGGIYDDEERTLNYPGLPAISLDDAENISIMFQVARNIGPLCDEWSPCSRGEAANIIASAAYAAAAKCEAIVADEARAERLERMSGALLRERLDEYGVPLAEGFADAGKQYAEMRFRYFVYEAADDGKKEIYGYPVIARRRATIADKEWTYTCHHHESVCFEALPDGTGFFFSSKGVGPRFHDFESFQKAAKEIEDEELLDLVFPANEHQPEFLERRGMEPRPV